MLSAPTFKTPMMSAITPMVGSLTPPRNDFGGGGNARPASALSAASSLSTLANQHRPHTAAANPSSAARASSDDLDHLLFIHCCAVAALSAKLPADADVSPHMLKQAMRLFERPARKRVKAVANLSPLQAVATLTQLFIFEGLSCREEQEALDSADRRAEVDALRKTNWELQEKLAASAAEVQGLREAMLQVQTATNRQVMEARDQNAMLARDAQAQAAEVKKLAAYCEKLKADLEVAQVRAERGVFDLGGSDNSVGRAGNVQRRGPTSPSSRTLGSVPANNTGLSLAIPAEDVAAAPLCLSSPMRTSPTNARSALRSPKTSGNVPPPVAIPSSSSGLHRTSSVRVGFTPTGAKTNAAATKVLGTGARTESFRRQQIKQFAPNSPQALDDESDVGGFGGGYSDVSSQKVPAVPTEDYTEAVYMYLGGTPDKLGKLDSTAVLRYLETTYDNLGDPMRFSRLLRRFKTMTLAELSIVLLQLAAV